MFGYGGSRVISMGMGQFAQKGQSSFEFGRERIRTDKSSNLYFENWFVAEKNNKLIGAFLGFIVEDQNTVACVFYEKSNYREVDRRPSIPFPGSQDSGDHILMSKRLHYLNDNLSKC